MEVYSYEGKKANEVFEKALSDLKIENIDWKVLNDMDNVREEGNLAAHENEYRREYLKRTINSFIRVLEFFNNI